MQLLNYKNNDIRINESGQICLSDMIKPYGQKRLNDWIRALSTQEYLKELSKQTSFKIGELVVVKHGKPTYADNLVAIHFAQWLSPDFYVWCNIHIRNSISSNLDKPVETEILPQTNMSDIELILKVDAISDARLKELAIQKLTGQSIPDKQKQFPEVQYGTVTTISAALGYTMNQQQACKLGKYIAKHYQAEGKVRSGNNLVRNYIVTPQLKSEIGLYCYNTLGLTSASD